MDQLTIVSIVLRVVCIVLDSIMSVVNFRMGNTKNGVCWAILAGCFLGLIILQIYRAIKEKKDNQPTEEEG